MNIKTIFTLAFILFNSYLHAQNAKNKIQISKESLDVILEKNRHFSQEGKVADYIPELGKMDPNALAFAVVNQQGKLVSAGDVQKKFTMQSISKIIALMIAVMEQGEQAVFDKMGYFGTDKAFNHFANLEATGKPLNPMMNAGAILTTSLISGADRVPFEKIRNMLRFICDNPSIDYNPNVYKSEKETGNRNRAMFYILKNAGSILGNEDQLDNYFRQCSIELTVEDLAKIGYFFAHQCIRLDGDKRYKNAEISKLIQSQMLIAGMYDFSGEYARTVGLPSKSGVGGGIVVSVPNTAGIGVFSAPLDKHGNSLAGYHLILDLVQQYNLSLF